MAIADEIAAKESVQVQQPLPHIQSVNSVSKNSAASSSSSVDSVSKNSAVCPSSGGNSRVTPSLRQGVHPNLPLATQSNSYACFSCGNAGHGRSNCRFRNATFRNCSTKGHIARACRKNGVNAVCGEGELTKGPLFEEDELFLVYDVNAISRAEISDPLKIPNNDSNILLDTGCVLSLAPMSSFKRVYPDVDMQPTNVVLSTYTGETV